MAKESGAVKRGVSWKGEWALVLKSRSTGGGGGDQGWGAALAARARVSLRFPRWVTHRLGALLLLLLLLLKLAYPLMVESTTGQLPPPLNLLEREGSGSEINCRTPVCPRDAASSRAVSLLKPGVSR